MEQEGGQGGSEAASLTREDAGSAAGEEASPSVRPQIQRGYPDSGNQSAGFLGRLVEAFGERHSGSGQFWWGAGGWWWR